MQLPKPIKREARVPKPLRRGGRILRSDAKKGTKTSRHRKKRVSASKRADDAARALCHVRGVCEAAGWNGTVCKGVLQWAHILPRDHRRNNLRWRQDACLLLCAGHHFRWTRKNYAEWRAFLYQKVGLEKILELEREAMWGEKGDPKAFLATLPEVPK